MSTAFKKAQKLEKSEKSKFDDELDPSSSSEDNTSSSGEETVQQIVKNVVKKRQAKQQEKANEVEEDPMALSAFKD